MSRVGVLAVQGAFIEHERMLEALGCECFEIRRATDLDTPMDGLVLPGGESTVMGKLTRDLGMFDRLREMISGGLPVLGTCAGMILLADRIENDPLVHFGTMPITVRRNAYGRQLGSFSSEADFLGRTIPLEFIRAPMVVSLGEGTETLCSLGEVPVAVRHGNQLATAFHPELTDDGTVHGYFLSIIDDH